jgi:hypothetical protein
MLRHHVLVSCLSLVGAGACTTLDDISTTSQAVVGDGIGGDAPADEPARALRTFDAWLAEHPEALDEDQRAALDETGYVPGVVPAEELPIKHRNGTIEVDDDTAAAFAAGDLDIDENFTNWIDHGLYDPDMEVQHAQYEFISAGVVPPLVEDIKVDEAKANCVIVVALVTARLQGNPIPQQSSTNNDTCGEAWTNDIARSSQYANNASRYATGGLTTDPGAFDNDTCSATSQQGGGRMVASTWPVVIDRRSSDPTKPLDCRDVTAEISITGRSAIRNRGTADVTFMYIGENWRGRKQYKALAQTEVQATTFGTAVNAGGSAEVGSECEGTHEIGATVSASNSGVGGEVGFKAGKVCKLQTSANARLNLNVEASSTQTTKVAPLHVVQLSVETVNARSQGTSAYPAAGVGNGAYEYEAVSTGTIASEFGCMSAKITGCDAKGREGATCLVDNARFWTAVTTHGGWGLCNGRFAW